MHFIHVSHEFFGRVVRANKYNFDGFFWIFCKFLKCKITLKLSKFKGVKCSLRCKNRREQAWNSDMADTNEQKSNSKWFSCPPKLCQLQPLLHFFVAIVDPVAYPWWLLIVASTRVPFEFMPKSYLYPYEGQLFLAFARVLLCTSWEQTKQGQLKKCFRG